MFYFLSFSFSFPSQNDAGAPIQSNETFSDHVHVNGGARLERHILCREARPVDLHLYYARSAAGLHGRDVYLSLP